MRVWQGPDRVKLLWTLLGTHAGLWNVWGNDDVDLCINPGALLV